MSNNGHRFYVIRIVVTQKHFYRFLSTIVKRQAVSKKYKDVSFICRSRLRRRHVSSFLHFQRIVRAFKPLYVLNNCRKDWFSIYSAIKIQRTRIVVYISSNISAALYGVYSHRINNYFNKSKKNSRLCL